MVISSRVSIIHKVIFKLLTQILEQAEQALSPEERRIFSQIFSIVDNEGLGVVTGDVAIRFLPDKTKLPSEILGEVGSKQE